VQLETSVVVCSVVDAVLEEEEALDDEIEEEVVEDVEDTVEFDVLVEVRLVVEDELADNDELELEDVVVELDAEEACTASTNHIADSPGFNTQLPDVAPLCGDVVTRYEAALVCQPFGWLCASRPYPGGAVIPGPPWLPIIRSTMSFGLEVE